MFAGLIPLLRVSTGSTFEMKGIQNAKLLGVDREIFAIFSKSNITVYMLDYVHEKYNSRQCLA